MKLQSVTAIQVYICCEVNKNQKEIMKTKQEE